MTEGKKREEAGYERGLLSVVIPVFNEKDTLREIVDALDVLEIHKEVIVVDDGSTDGSDEVIRSLEKEGRITAVYGKENRGKGMAFRLGLAKARGEVVMIQDADLEYDPKEIPLVVEKIFSGSVEMCYGSRILGQNKGKSSLAFYLGGRLVSIVATFLYGKNITDEPTCYKAFRTSLLKKIKIEGEGFEFEPEITAKGFRLGWKYAERPISYSPRSFQEGKKISWKDGVRAIWTLLLWRFKRIEEEKKL